MMAAEGHAVDVSRGRGFGVFMSPVRVKPEVADLLFFLAEMVATPAATPAAMEWSPPRTSGRKTFN